MTPIDKLTLKGQIPFSLVLEGEKPDFFTLPKPEWHYCELDRTGDMNLRWKAFWTGYKACKKVRQRVSSNLRYWKSIRKLYESIQSDSDKSDFPEEDMDFLLKKVDFRVRQWKNTSRILKTQV